MCSLVQLWTLGCLLTRFARSDADLAADSLLFLLTSLTSIAIFLYLPHHVAFLINRAWFYAHGDSQFDAAQSLLQGVAAAEKAGANAAVHAAAAVESMADAAATVVREL